MNNKRIALYGAGKLGTLITNALIKGFLPEYELIAVYSRSAAKAEKLAESVNKAELGFECKPVKTQEELLQMPLDYIIEAASPKAMKTLTIPALKKGISLICLSIGAFADQEFYQEAGNVAKRNKARIHFASGAIGGFDVLQTASLMGDCKVSFSTEKGPESLKNTSVYNKELKENKRVVFSGNAKEAIAAFPTKVNVAVAASLASVGPENEKVAITSVPYYIGDKHTIRINNEQVDAEISIYSKTAEIAGWSVVTILRNLNSPFVFG